ncbi:hypothetical protein P8452_28720 [Trifolium repens]|nr:hypothetical protein P8452_28720 [Trifolium repens]
MVLSFFLSLIHSFLLHSLSLRCNFYRTPGSAFFDNCISTYLNIFALDRYSFSSIFKLNDLCGGFIKLKKSVLLL